MIEYFRIIFHNKNEETHFVFLSACTIFAPLFEKNI